MQDSIKIGALTIAFSDEAIAVSHVKHGRPDQTHIHKTDVIDLRLALAESEGTVKRWKALLRCTGDKHIPLMSWTDHEDPPQAPKRFEALAQRIGLAFSCES